MSHDSRIRVLVVDDEPLACRKILGLLSGRSELEVLGSASSVEEARQKIHEQNPDLLFLDIQMEDTDGFALLKSLPLEKHPYVIFVTAYEQYAIQAFEIRALDYLLKPFDRKRFDRALGTALDRIHSDRKKNLVAEISGLLKEWKSKTHYMMQFLVEEKRGSMTLVPAEEVNWIEASGRYVYLRSGQKSWLLREQMRSLEKKLDPAMFVRIHKSAIVNIRSIRELQPLFHGDQRVVLKNGTTLIWSRSYRSALDALRQKPAARR